MNTVECVWDVGGNTRSALLYAQMQEGLKCELMHAPAVSGAQAFIELGKHTSLCCLFAAGCLAS